MKFAGVVAFGLAVGSGASAKTIEVFGDKTDKVPYPLQAAIDSAEPGDTILLNPGVYNEDIQSHRDGKMAAPITIKGPKSAVIRGLSGGSIVSINHDHIHLEGFSINGSGEQEEQGDPDPENYHDHLIHVHGNRVRTVKYDNHNHRSGVTGFKAKRLAMSHAGSTCVKMTYFVTHSEIHSNDILDCGGSSSKCVDDVSNGCGRGLDVGTPWAQRMEGIGGEMDECAWNTIKGNTFSNIGGACLVVFEGARANLIDDNTCLGSNDAESAGMVLRGIANILRYNSITGAAGAGVALGGVTSEEDCAKYGIFNEVYHNQLASNEGGPLLNGTLPEPSGRVCSNSAGDDAIPELTQDCPSDIESSASVVSTTSTTDSSEEAASAASASGTTPPAESTKTGEDGATAAAVAGGGGYRCHPVLFLPGDVDTSELGEGTEDAGVDGAVVLDKDPDTYWSRQGEGQWLEFDMGGDSVVDPPTVEAIEIKFFPGADGVEYFFQVTADGEEVLSEGIGLAKEGAQIFSFDAGGVKANKIRFNGQGKTDGSSGFVDRIMVETIALCQGTPIAAGTQTNSAP